MLDIPLTRKELRAQLIWLALATAYMLAAGTINALPGNLVAAHYGEIGWGIFIAAIAVILSAFFFGKSHAGMLTSTTIIVPVLTLTFMTRAAESEESSPLAFAVIGVLFASLILFPSAKEMAEDALHGINKRTENIFFTGYAITPLSTLAWFVTGANIDGYMLLPVAGLLTTFVFFRWAIPKWLEGLKANMPLPESQEWDVVTH